MTVPQLNELCFPQKSESYAPEHSYSVLRRVNDKSEHLPAMQPYSWTSTICFFCAEYPVKEMAQKPDFTEREGSNLYQEQNRVRKQQVLKKFRVSLFFLNLMDFAKRESPLYEISERKQSPHPLANDKSLCLKQHLFKFNLFSLAPQKPSKFIYFSPKD